ncbi:phosphoglucosamine mutase, partial [Oceanithermus sp.]
YFGTDGIRGRAGEEPLTPDFVLRLGRAAGRYFAAESQRPVVLLAKDTRESCDMLEAALAAGLLSQGVAVEHLGILPTPGVAYLTGELGADAGVMISASHNPYHDNGIKFFGPGGRKLSDEAELAIEAYLEEPFPAAKLATVRNHQEAERLYIDRLVSIGPRLDGLKVALDTANGATYRAAVRVFQRLGAEVFAIFNTPDGRNINKGCGSTHPEALQRLVVEGGFDVGFAFDGDGDRVVMVDERGRLAHGDYVLLINAVVRDEPGVVGTIMSNMALERALQKRGIAFERAPVGDRYVYQRLLERGWRLGGEQSGHVLFMDKLHTGDGIQTALLTLAALQESGRRLSEWVDEMPMYPQLLLNVEVRDKERIMSHEELPAWIAEAEEIIGDGRVNVRPSGTEPLVRVMAEGASEELVRAAAEMLAERIGRIE